MSEQEEMKIFNVIMGFIALLTMPIWIPFVLLYLFVEFLNQFGEFI